MPNQIAEEPVSVEQTLAPAGRQVLRTVRRSLRGLLAIIERAFMKFQVNIGWRKEPSAGKVEVVTRPFLPLEFVADVYGREVPASYRRLFPFEPVHDLGFLVGREREMDAIATARERWDEGRPVALAITGEQGSGKTSLINCAVQRSFADLEIVRGEFDERLITERQLRSFLAGLLGVADPSQLENALAERRRVIILEQLERAFLRQVGHYAAVRALQRLIAAISASTLWILIINQVAFRFLDSAVGLGDTFSHRISVGSVSPAVLRQAVLARHNRSGLRLHFTSESSVSKLSHWLGDGLRGQADPEMKFFNHLSRESAGIFRAAFAIWLAHIKTVSAESLLMKPLAPLNFSPLIAGLDLADLFTLVAVMQHGSLTPLEHAAVFQRPLAASQAQTDELLAREIIEPDPFRPGFRVRPEALRLVNEALYRRNLL